MKTIDQLPGPLLREVARLYVRAQRTEIACCDGASNVQCHVLTELLRNDGMTQRALVERLNLDKGWISRAVDGLVEAGAVTKSQNEVDRRSVKLSLTAAGLQRAEKLEHQLNSHAVQLLSSIPADRHAQIQEALDFLLQALQADGQKLPSDKACAAPNSVAPMFRSATAGDWPAIEALLREAALPLEGAREHLDHFVVGMLEDRIVCAGGLEIYGSDALLRSVVVAKQFRGLKYGVALVGTVMRLAHERRVARLFLLTTTAESYFGVLGFVPAAREDVPEAVKQSREFQGVCPASATLLTASTLI